MVAVGWEPKSFDDSFETALRRGWSVDYYNNMAMKLLIAPCVRIELYEDMLGTEPSAEAQVILSAVDLLVDHGFAMEAPLTFNCADSFACLVVTSEGSDAMLRMAAAIRASTGPRHTRAATVRDIALAHHAAKGFSVFPSVYARDLTAVTAKLDEGYELQRGGIGHGFVAWTKWPHHAQFMQLATILPEQFLEADKQLISFGLLDEKGQQVTPDGMRVMHEFGGSVTTFTTYKARVEENRPMGDSFTTNIGGNGNTVGNTGSMSGGEITQNIAQGEHVEFATDAEVFKKLAEILKGLPGDDHDDDLMEAMQLKKAAEANDGKLPDPEHKSQAKKLWKKVAEPIAEKGSDIVAKALAEYFSKLTTG